MQLLSAYNKFPQQDSVEGEKQYKAWSLPWKS